MSAGKPQAGVGDRRIEGIVYLVGAGPGDPRLITVRGLDCLSHAEVLFYDDLAHPDLVEKVPADCERIYVGKRAGFQAMGQEETNQLLVDYAKKGKGVVRLKGGDPFVFGRGGEEAIALIEAGVPFEVVPGITSGFAAPAYAGIPVTHRGLSTQVTLVTGHEDTTKREGKVDWRALAKAGGTLVVYMGVGNRQDYGKLLIEGGRDPQTPVAAIQWGTRPEQHVVRGTLATLADLDVSNPAAIVIGDVAGLDLAWFSSRPLAGRTIMVTRTREQASALVAELRDAGAEVLEVPTIEIVDPEDWGPVDEAIVRLDTFDWLLFASPNGVNRFLERVLKRTGDIRSVGKARFAAIGPATAGAVRAFGLAVDLVPERHASEGMAGALRDVPGVESARFLIPRPEVARSEAPNALRELGASVEEVVVYRTVPPRHLSRMALDRLDGETVDLVTFTSSSTVTHFVDLVGACLGPDRLKRIAAASIGPTTTETARKHGLYVKIEAPDDDLSIRGLIGAIHEHFQAVKKCYEVD